MMNKKIKGRTDRYQLQGRFDRFARGVADSAEKALAGLEENPDRPNNLDYFVDLMRDVFVRNRWAERFMQYADNKKIIGIYCMMVPEELIYAAGAIPVRFSGGSYEGHPVSAMNMCPVTHVRWLRHPSVQRIWDILLHTRYAMSLSFLPPVTQNGKWGRNFLISKMSGCSKSHISRITRIPKESGFSSFTD